MREYSDGKWLTDAQEELVDWVGENINDIARASLECVLLDGVGRFVGISPAEEETIRARAKEKMITLPI